MRILGIETSCDETAAAVGNGADLASITENLDTTTATGRMVFKLLAVFAEFERDLLSERTSAALQHKARKGEIDPVLGRDDEEAEDAEKILLETRIVMENGRAARRTTASTRPSSRS